MCRLDKIDCFIDLLLCVSLSAKNHNRRILNFKPKKMVSIYVNLRQMAIKVRHQHMKRISRNEMGMCIRTLILFKIE